MKKISSLLTILLCSFAISCTSDVGVDSSVNNIAVYDHLTGDFYGQIPGTVPTAFKATNTALRQNFKWFATGQDTKKKSKQVLRVRTDEDNLVYVTLIQRDESVVDIEISSENSSIMFNQKVFNEIAKENNKLIGGH